MAAARTRTRAGAAASAADPDGTRAHRWRVPSPIALALGFGLVYLPFVGLGYGTDIDITNIRRSGASILDGDYRYARPPGAFPHESITGLLDRIGGPTSVNIASVAMATIVLIGLGHLVERHHGRRAGAIAVLLIATQPWFWVAATSLGDYLYALAFLLLGIDAAQRDRRILAGVLFATAIGMRSTTAVLVAAYLLAEVTGGSIDDEWLDPDQTLRRSHWRAVLMTGSVTIIVAAAWFVPPWLSAGRTTEFLDNQLVAGDLAVMVARWGVKNIAFFGVPLLIVLVVRAPVLWPTLREFRSLVLVRFALFVAVFAEVLYLRFPWKPIHLLPVMLAVALLVALSSRTSNRFVLVLVVCNLTLAVVSVSIAEPDVADAATTGFFRPGWTRGVVINDIACRLDPEYGEAWPDLDSPEADLAAVQAFACQARSWRAGKGPSQLPTDGP